MNRSKIEWCDHTWNPITGCRHDCPYCYARTMTSRFAGDVRLNKMAKKDYSMVPAADGGEDLYVLNAPMLNETGNPLVYPFGFAPTLHRYRMNIPGKLKMGNNIFVGAMADVFGAWVPDQWIKEIFDVCKEYPLHNYLFLTKNPDRYMELYMKDLLPECKNMWYGLTITDMGQSHAAEAITQDLPAEAHSFLSIEPILEDLTIKSEHYDNCLEIVIGNFTDWVIIGAETGRRKDKVIPKKEWIENIVRLCDESEVPVFMKDSLIPIIGESNMRRDFPKELQRKTVSKKMQNKLYSKCSKCKVCLKKSDMITLLARSKRGEQPKQFGFMCKDCFMGFCEDLGIDVPKLAEFIKEAEVRVTFGQ